MFFLTFSVQECLNKLTNLSINAVPKPQQTQTPSIYYGKLIDNPNVMPAFTIENVLDYLIYRKEEDCLRAEDWKNFKTGGFKLFKEGHVQNIMVSHKGAVFEIECKCLPEMKKDRVYEIKVEISTNTSSVHLAECSCPAGMKLIKKKMMMYLARQNCKCGTNQEKDDLILNLPMIYHSR